MSRKNSAKKIVKEELKIDHIEFETSEEEDNSNLSDMEMQMYLNYSNNYENKKKQFLEKQIIMVPNKSPLISPSANQNKLSQNDLLQAMKKHETKTKPKRAQSVKNGRTPKAKDESKKKGLFSNFINILTQSEEKHEKPKKRTNNKTAPKLNKEQNKAPNFPIQFKEDQITLPSDYANQVLEQEFKIEAGKFDVDDINKLIKMYSRAVEYYSGMNDEKYIYFTERIQNMLCRPDILKMMN